MTNARCEYTEGDIVNVEISPWVQPTESVIGTHGVYDVTSLVEAICQQKPKDKPCKFNSACTGLVRIEKPTHDPEQPVNIRITIESD
ncbi:MAG: hypothetical protein E6P95_02510 [Candidatus Moraniibacteriota bacterium]|nr:MAG: hypothetical protein E6P95_02510 [Candidatus Moranbacteria bacterium]